MKIIKKINTSSVLCIDSDGRQVVAFGRGIGFCAIGENVALSRIQRTFYRVDSRYVGIIDELPDDVLEFSSQLVDIAPGLLCYELSPNLPFILADHIAYAIKRVKDGIVVRMPLSFDVAQQYPLEHRLGTLAVERLGQRFKMSMPKHESAGIAMTLINNSVDAAKGVPFEREGVFEAILTHATDAVELVTGVAVDRGGFDYARFATHLQYLYGRMKTGHSIKNGNAKMYDMLRDQYPSVAACVDTISSVFENKTRRTLSGEERLYLMMHVNRIVARADRS